MAIKDLSNIVGGALFLAVNSKELKIERYIKQNVT